MGILCLDCMQHVNCHLEMPCLLQFDELCGVNTTTSRIIDSLQTKQFLWTFPGVYQFLPAFAQLRLIFSHKLVGANFSSWARLDLSSVQSLSQVDLSTVHWTCPVSTGLVHCPLDLSTVQSIHPVIQSSYPLSSQFIQSSSHPIHCPVISF